MEGKHHRDGLAELRGGLGWVTGGRWVWREGLRRGRSGDGAECFDCSAKNFPFYPKGRGRVRFCVFRSVWNLEVSVEGKESTIMKTNLLGLLAGVCANDRPGRSAFIRLAVHGALGCFWAVGLLGLPCLSRTVWLGAGCRHNVLERPDW